MGVLVSIEFLRVTLLLDFMLGGAFLFVFLFVVLGAVLGLLFFIINVKDYGHDQVSWFFCETFRVRVSRIVMLYSHEM